ncbi:MAG: hypothetical protein ABJ358_10735, partial [Rhizobiaceae bacterium]
MLKPSPDPAAAAVAAANLDSLSVQSAADLEASNMPVVVAVSGGSDSLALLHWLVEQHPTLNLHV